MTMCPNSKAACECQPQDGVMCPHGPTPNDWKPYDDDWAPNPNDDQGTAGVAATGHQTKQRSDADGT